MNNATPPDSIHPSAVPSKDNNQDISGKLTREDSFNPAEQKDISEVLHGLDQVRYTPRAKVIRAIMKHARTSLQQAGKQ